MPDISMCKNNKCPLKETCYRYRANPSSYQSYANFTYKDGCDYYWKFEGSRGILNQLRDIVEGNE